MASDATRLCVVNLYGKYGSNLRPLDIEEAVNCVMSRRNELSMAGRDDLLDIMSRDVADREEQHGIGDLTMEPQVLI